MKQRYSSLDVKAAALELSSALVGLRIANIYDLSSRIFLFKVAKPDVRKQFLIDAGFRCHLTEYSRTTAPAPSPFISRLRKFLKSRRITRVSQVGTDRILHFEFGDGQFHLLLEFFAAGNIILTDNEFKIIGLLRNVPAGSGQDEIRVGLTYILDNKQNYKGIPPLSVERLKEALEEAKGQDENQADTGTKKKIKKKKVEALRRALAHAFPEYPPPLIQHALQSVDYDTSLRPEQILEDNARIEKLMLALQIAEDVRSQLDTVDSIRGYIVSRPDKSAQEARTEEDDQSQKQKLVYEDFHPFEPKQFADATILPFANFNKAVDEFFSSVEAQKLESRLTERESAAKKKLDAARRDQEKRVGALKEVQELHILKAQAVEANMQRVQEAMNAVNGLIAQGMDWTEIARLIEMEQDKKNPVAATIKLPLKLYENTITLLLGEPGTEEELDESDESEEEESDQSSEDEDEDEKTARAIPKKPKNLSIDIDLGLTPWANATQYYGQKKTAAFKEEKTLQASNKALKSAERKINSDLKQGMKQEKPVLRPARTPFWFEKFFFFISSEGYLVLGGRDVQQNDLLYRRHLKRGDVYVHADIKGAVPVIVKNRIGTSDAPIPPGTLSQAGTFSVTTSTAWDSKALMGAWWVRADQVSKIAHTGDYVATGDVVIRGEKNHLAPGQLILGFAVLFQISPESVQNHTKHRVQDDDAPVVEAEDAEGQASDGSAADTAEAEEESREDAKEDEPDSGLSEAEDQANETRNPLLSSKPPEDGVGTRDDLDSRHSPEEVKSTPQASIQTSTNEEELPQDSLGAQESEEQGQEVSNAEEKEEEEEVRSRASTSLPSRTSTPSAAPSAMSSKPQQQVRGKHGKKKKLAEKYKEQDEEDRELALRLLGSTSKSTAQSTSDTAGPSRTSGPAADKAKTKVDRQAEMEVQKQRRREQHDRAAQAERRRQEALQRGDEITEAGDEVDEIPDLESLPSLVGNPVAGDEVIAAIPVCAPWSALGQYRYRVKMQPGSLKKGKAVREILGRWLAEGAAKEKERAKGQRKKGPPADQKEGEREDMESSEQAFENMALELIKGWRDVEVVNTLPVSGVRIVAGAGPGAAGNKAEGKSKGKKGGGKGGRGSKKK